MKLKQSTPLATRRLAKGKKMVFVPEPNEKPRAPLDTSGGVNARLGEIGQRLQFLDWQRREQQKLEKRLAERKSELERYLGISGEVSEALDVLSRELFSETLRVLEEKLTIALQEVLEQPICFKATPGFKNNAAVVEFSIDRGGFGEDIYRGQGGSVQNVLSVGLRLFALAQLDGLRHRRFLVLDEQDCWLKPELVPLLVKMVYQAAKELDFQIIMISHHDVKLFEKYADRIYQFHPSADGVTVERVVSAPFDSDEAGDSESVKE
ncbi:MAG: DNA repair protein [Mariniblastus sp.]|nr:DNA repair protein [Mariniblastus sp.]